MKKSVSAVLAFGILFCLSIFCGCSNLLERGSESECEYGSLTVGAPLSRAVQTNEIMFAKVSVIGSDMQPVTVDTIPVSGGKGSFTVEQIPVGKNRIIEVEAYDSSDVISGFVISAVTDIRPGNNTVTVNWTTTGLGNVYKELLSKGENISAYSSEQNEAIQNAVPKVKGYLVDSAAIATDFIADSLKSADAYTCEYASLSYTAVNASGWTITVYDPCSESKTLSSDGSGSVTGIAPGTWKVVVTDGTNVVSSKKLTFAGGKPTVAGTIGNPLAGKVIIFVKCGANTKLYSWTETSEKKLSGEWDGTVLTESATSVYMNNPAGWYMLDVTTAYGTSSETINIILISGGNQTDDLKSGIAGTFWYDGAEFYDSDPTAQQLSDDATLSSISVNGIPVEGFSAGKTSYNTTIAADVDTAIITVSASDSEASVSVNPSGSAPITGGGTQVFTITVTAADGKTTKTYTVSVKRAVKNDVSLVSVSVNGKSASSSGADAYTYAATGSDESFAVSSIVATPLDSAATVTYSATSGTVADGGSQVFTITVKNGTKSASYTLTVTYTRKETVQSQYYWTNKDGAVGTNKTISSLADWQESMKIAQAAACDTPRAWLGGHEYPDPDLYAIFAAWDDTNLYLMVEIPNVDDAETIDNDKSYAGSQFLPMGWVLNTGKRPVGDGTLADGASVWQKTALYTWSTGIDTMLMYHPRLGIGEPSIFLTNSNGKFTYEPSDCIGFQKAGIERDIYFNECVSKNMWAAVVDDEGNWGGKSSKDMTSYTYKDYLAAGKKMTAYQITVPLSVLGITKTYIESEGISVGVFSTYGASTMDCIPWDSCMIDVADEAYSSDPSSSKEKEDVDNITSSLARIGHM